MDLLEPWSFSAHDSHERSVQRSAFVSALGADRASRLPPPASPANSRRGCPARNSSQRFGGAPDQGAQHQRGWRQCRRTRSSRGRRSRLKPPSSATSRAHRRFWSRTQARQRRGPRSSAHPISAKNRDGCRRARVPRGRAAGIGCSGSTRAALPRSWSPAPAGRSPAKDIEGAHPARALAGQSGLPDAASLTVAFDNEIKPMQVEAAITAELRIVRLGYDPRSGRFDISLELPGSAIARKLPMPFSPGSIQRGPSRQLVPNARPIAQGEVVRAKRPRARHGARRAKAAPNVIHEAEQGRRPWWPNGALARPARPSARSDFRQAGGWSLATSSVTISYEVPGVTVSIRGQALEPGAQGDPHQRAQRAIQEDAASDRHRSRAASASANLPASSRVATPAHPTNTR